MFIGKVCANCGKRLRKSEIVDTFEFEKSNKYSGTIFIKYDCSNCGMQGEIYSEYYSKKENNLDE